MTLIERQVRIVRHRLWINRWLRLWGWTILAAAAAWTAVWIADRLFALHLPVRWMAYSGLGLSVFAAIIWTAVTRERDAAAAAALDEAAGLKERVATGLAVMGDSSDPFALAVVADAQLAVTGLAPRKVLPIQWNRSLSCGVAMLALAIFSLLLPEFDLLGRKEAQANEQSRRAAISRLAAVVAKPASVIKEVADKNPDLGGAKDVKALEDALKQEKAGDPDALRREAVKQLDRLSDALKNKTDTDRFKAFDDTKKRLSQMGEPSDPKSEVGRLMESMASGDFQEAQKSIKQLQEQLAKRSHDGKTDPAKVQQMQKQLEELADKLNKAGEDKQSQRELENAGLSKAEAKRILEALAKKDKKQLEKMAKELEQRLKDKGVSQQQIAKMLEKMKERQEGSKQCKGMGQKMADAAKAMKSGDSKGAGQELEQAGEQLSEMEQMEQSLNDVEGQMAQLDNARDELNKEGEGQGDEDNGKCPKCKGTGFRPDGSFCPH